jgi:FG-GAP-like repeat/Dockerin type I domain/Cohesin domain
MKPTCFTLGWIFLTVAVQAATVNYIQNSVNDVDGSTIGAVFSNQYLETASTYSTVTAPATSSTYRFTHWTNSSSPATVYRDAWGRSLNPVSFVLLEDTTLAAHYLPATLDTDGDGVPDWYEIEYFGDLTRSATYDGDGDGLTLLTEYTGGTHPLYANSSLEGGVAYADSGLVTCNLAGYASYTLRSVPAGTVTQTTTVAPPGTVVTTASLSANATFGYWELDGVRQQDAWGVALPQISFTMAAVDREAVAYLFAGDGDGDGVPDAYEQYHFGSLTNGAASDTDGDGFTLLTEYTGGTNPNYGNSHQEGGVAYADSAMVTVNLADYSRYTLSSVPAGTVDVSAIVPDGAVITTPNLSQSTFGYWELDGVRQQDAWGVALRQISFTVNGAERAGVAYLLSGDSDGDGVNDGFEQFYFGSLANGAASDSDGDGATLLAEYTGGSSPLYGNSHQEGGVGWADSGLVVVNLQPYDRLSKIQVDGVLTDFFSTDPGVVSGIDAGTWSATAVTDWDGDGNLDLFIGSEEGLRVFRNIGTARSPNFQEITTGFTGLAAYVASVNRPSLTGGDWNGDGKGDLIIGGNTGTLRLIASGGTFTSNGSGTDLAVGSTMARPALGDMNADGKADLIVLLDDGTARLYLNNGLAMPFAGPGTDNFLGVTAPAGTSITTGDINQDGVTDVLLADSDGRIWEFIADGTGSFTIESKVWGGSYDGFAAGLTLAATDLEGDGDLDLIGGLANGGVISLRNPKVGRPTGLIATPGANSVQLEWDANWESRIRGYYIYRAVAEAGPYGSLLANYVSLPSHLDTTVSSGVPYYYYVSGVSYFFTPGNSVPRVVESLPSDVAISSAGKVILSVQPVTGKTGKTVKILLSIENAMAVAGIGMQIKVAYDIAKLQPLSQAQPGKPTVVSTGLSKNLTFTDNGATATGELVIDGSAGSLEPGSGKLFTLQFKVAEGVPNGSILGVNITQATMRDINGNVLTVEFLALAQPVSGDTFIEGDLTGDGLVTDADKTLLQDLIKPNSRAPTADELMAGDLNGDGKLDQKDLVLLKQLLAAPPP